jgi:hypothetical protein
MADSLFNPDLLQEAVEGFQEFSARFQEIADADTGFIENTVRFLKRIPAEDMAKKRELAKFFQSELGQGYDRKARKAAYDELLGEGRNKELRG